MPDIFDARPCFLGEGPLWHPLRRELFWFDIIGKRMLSSDRITTREWQFDSHFSAAGWLDEGHLMLASEAGLWGFTIASGALDLIVPLEADQPETRSNDGRADPWGGFWIGTMGKKAQTGLGGIYRYYRGELRKLHSGITISNAICFDPERGLAYFADTAVQKIWRQRLDDKGWPMAEPELFLDLAPQGLWPDGAVVDGDGGLWNAQWGAARVARYTPDGRFDRALAVRAPHVTCPAFADGRLLTTTAQEGLDAETLTRAPLSGQVFDLGPVEFAHHEPAVRL